MNRQKGQELLDVIAHYRQFGQKEDFQGHDYNYWVEDIFEYSKKEKLGLELDKIETESDLKYVSNKISKHLLSGAQETETPKQLDQTLPEHDVLEKKPPDESDEENESLLPEDLYKQSIKRAEEEAYKRRKLTKEAKEKTTVDETTTQTPDPEYSKEPNTTTSQGIIPDELYVTQTEEPKKLPLTKIEAQKLVDDTKAALNDPVGYAENLTQEILKKPETQSIALSIGNQTAKEVAGVAAIVHTDNLRHYGQSLPISPEEKVLASSVVIPKQNIRSSLIGLIDSNNPELVRLVPDPYSRQQISGAAQTLSVSDSTQTDFMRAVLPDTGYPDDVFYQTKTTASELTMDHSPNGYIINTTGLTNVSTTLNTTYQQRKSEDKGDGVDVGVDELKKLNNLRKHIKSDWSKVSSRYGSRWGKNANFLRNIQYGATGQVPVSSSAAATALSFGTTTTLLEGFTATTTITPYFALPAGVASDVSTLTAMPVAKLTSGSVSLVSEISVPYTIADSSGKILAAGLGVAEKTSEAAILAVGTNTAVDAVAVGAEVAIIGGTAGAGTGAATGAAAGTWATITGAISSIATPIIGLIVAAATYLFVKALPWIKKHWKELGVALLAVAAILISPVFIIPAIFLAAGMFITGSAAVTGVTGVLGAIFVGFKTLVIDPILVPLLIIFIVVPLIIAFVILIINSGAYVVPPGSLSTTQAGQQISDIDSPWVGIEKTASPSGPFDNSDLDGSIEITYSVRIWAKKAGLENIALENECRIRKESGSPTCDHPTPENDGDDDTETPASLGVNEEYVFTYTITYDDHLKYDDSYVIDTMKVTADAPDQPGALATSTASIIIGNPPSECPEGWPLQGKITITQGPGGIHKGAESIDFSASSNTQVYSTHAGEVTTSGDSGFSYGNYIRIKSTCEGVPFESLYAHLNSVQVGRGEFVTPGQPIGLSGGTGGFDPHLHYEFYFGLTMIEPYIPVAVKRHCYGALWCNCCN